VSYAADADMHVSLHVKYPLCFSHFLWN